jgi:hypothetical protein
MLPRTWIASPLLLLLATACWAPRIQQFELTPSTVCAGDPPSVGRWQAEGDLALQVSVDDRDSSAPEVRDHLQQLPPGSRLVTLRLTASRSGQERAAETRTIEQLPDSFETEIVFPALPEQGGVVATGTKNTARWGDRFEIGTIASGDGRTLVVRHADRTATVGPEPSPAFDGATLEGAWELWWTSDGQAPPEVLRVKATVRCKRRA